MDNADNEAELVDSPVISLCEDVDNNQQQAKPLSLLICVKPEDDFPHVRYLCFRNIFGKTSPEKHCCKCICYVCEKLAPCKKWNKPPKGHCHAIAKDANWRLERLKRKKPCNILVFAMAYHKLTVSALCDSDQEFRGSAGGMICNGYGDWMVGFFMSCVDNIDANTSPVLHYTALLEGLKLAWSYGFRCLEVVLGFAFQGGPGFSFTKDYVNKKLCLSIEKSSVNEQTWKTMKDVEDYLNREWNIEVKYSETLKEEGTSMTMTVWANMQKVEGKEVFEFFAEPPTKDTLEAAHEFEIFDAEPHCRDFHANARRYMGLE